MSVHTNVSPEETEALLSHVLSLRRDFINDLLRGKVRFAGLKKGELRGQLKLALEEGLLSVEDVLNFLAEREPAGKQHVFLYRAQSSVNDEWQSSDAVIQAVEEAGYGDLLEAELPVAMPEELTLSSIKVDESEVEITAVEARRYTEHIEDLDEYGEADDGTEIEWRAFAHRVARSTVRLRWDLTTRGAELHITQATEKGTVSNYYGEVVQRFSQQIGSFLDFSKFQPINMHKVLHELARLEQGANPLTRSRETSFESPGGSNVRARSPSRTASLYEEQVVRQALGSVDTPTSGLGGNLYWLQAAAQNGVLDDDLHTVIVAHDARVHFMRPSSVEAIAYVLGQVRSLS
ncbi:MAG TPA: hypothetical protein VFS54_05865 [Solirubrobacterales bacterium]|nr:hypothetical protein [Solirubrobacterales bacterium]